MHVITVPHLIRGRSNGLLATWKSLKSLIEARIKLGFWFKIKAAPCLNPQVTSMVVEDLRHGANTDIGPKDNFRLVSNICVELWLYSPPLPSR
jgi:hypothetical protein